MIIIIEIINKIKLIGWKDKINMEDNIIINMKYKI
jgi:hypothetical protein